MTCFWLHGSRCRSKRSRVGPRVAAGCLAIAALLLPSPASAHQLNPYAWSSAFNGSDSTAGQFSIKVGPISFDQSTGRVYVVDKALGSDKASVHDWVSQFSVAGVAVPFPALGGASSIDTGKLASSVGFFPPYDVAVDNSAAHRGFYVLDSGPDIAGIGGPLRSYGFDGLERAGFPTATTGNTLAVDAQGQPWVNNQIFDPLTGELIGNAPSGFPSFGSITSLAFDSVGNAYIAQDDASGHGLYKYDPQGYFLFQLGDSSVSAVAVDPSNDHVFSLNSGGVTEYTPQGVPLQRFADKSIGGFIGFQTLPHGLAVNESTHQVYISNPHFSTPRVEIFSPGTAVTVPDASTGESEATPSSATVHGVLNADNLSANPALKTTDCHFEWGISGAYGKPSVPCVEGNVFGDGADHSVSALLSGLVLGTTYHYRLAVKNSNGYYSFGLDQSFKAQGPPSSGEEFVSDVNTDGARLHATLDPNGGDTTYHFQYTPLDDFLVDGFDHAKSFPAKDAPLGSHLGVQQISQVISGLAPDTSYAYRAVPTNANDSVPGASHAFKTFPQPPISDRCPNAHVRQQTGARLLLDCRAYELVSASDTGGYDVASDLAPGQAPLSAHPRATDRLLYTLNFGAIPGIDGSPTNYGSDPYLAERSDEGWSTRYVGLPADAMADTGAFGSPLLGASSALSAFAFGGPGICEPCFSDGSTNIPLRLPDGSLVKGMVGSLSPPANSVGGVAEPFSANGSHFVFSSIVPFDSAAPPGVVTIYDRDLDGGTTQIVSTMPDGNAMGGAGNAELDASADGSRIVIGKLLSTDLAGNDYYHPYMHIGTDSHTVDLAPSTSVGVLFDGMTDDGTKVFFTSKEQLLGADTDHSADIYEAHVDQNGALSLALASVDSTGAPSNDDSCKPPSTMQQPAWNTAYAKTEGADCSALALAGGAGVASGSGAIYFLSPEQLDGAKGTKEQPNLYLKSPEGQTQFVATIDSSLIKPPKPPATHPAADTSLLIAQSGATGVAVDQAGSIYVLNNGTNRVRKYNSGGVALNYTAGANAGTNNLTGSDAPTGTFSFQAGIPNQIAIDRAGGFLYVPDYNHNVVDKFTTVGAYVSQVAVTHPTGVAVNPASGDLYVPSAAGGVKVFDSNGAPLPDVAVNATSIAVDRHGNLYGAAAGVVRSYDPSGAFAKELVGAGAVNLALDNSAEYPYDGQLYVDKGDQIVVLDTDGNQIETISNPDLTGSGGLAVGLNHHAYASRSNTRVAEFGFSDPPYAGIDSPPVLHATGQAAIHDTSDFQVSADGRYAAFGTRLPLSSYDNGGHSEIYRYDAQADALDCVSCTPSGAITATDAFLTPFGLNLTDDGRVFYTSAEPLVLRDTNARKDAYQWSDGEIELISTGTSSSDSGLLSVSADGTDAFFFTRQVLVSDDRNGGRIKIYDARATAGFPYLPPHLPCAASDECHGPGSTVPPPPLINTVTGAGAPKPAAGRGPRKPCRRGYVRRKGKCVKKKSKRSSVKRDRSTHNG